MTDQEPVKSENWWSKQSSGAKIAIGIAGVCCLGILILVVSAGMFAPDASTDYNTTDTSDSSESNVSSSSNNDTVAKTEKSSLYSGLNNPEEVKNIIDYYDANGDNKIEFLDEYSDDADGKEEYVVWAADAGLDSSDSETVTRLFMKFDSDSDWLWDINELDEFYDEYYS